MAMLHLPVGAAGASCAAHVWTVPVMQGLLIRQPWSAWRSLEELLQLSFLARGLRPQGLAPWNQAWPQHSGPTFWSHGLLG